MFAGLAEPDETKVSTAGRARDVVPPPPVPKPLKPHTAVKYGAGHLRAIAAIGGRKTSQDREHMAEIGRRGGKAERRKKEDGTRN